MQQSLNSLGRSGSAIAALRCCRKAAWATWSLEKCLQLVARLRLTRHDPTVCCVLEQVPHAILMCLGRCWTSHCTALKLGSDQAPLNTQVSFQNTNLCIRLQGWSTGCSTLHQSILSRQLRNEKTESDLTSGLAKTCWWSEIHQIYMKFILTLRCIK